MVDYHYAKEKGIPVCNVPAYGTAAVSQFSIALLLEICHHIGHHSEFVHAGKWTGNTDWCYWDYPLIELEGKTLGLIGFGRIGQAEGRIAKAMGMNVLAYDVYPNDSGHEIGEYVDLDTLFSKADVISLHCNLTPENAGLINRSNIAKMKDGAILINNARGQLIVEQDVADALNSGKLAAAGLDVVYTEPVRADNPLLNAKNCIITPHISWAPKESRQRIMDVTVQNIKAFLAGRPAKRTLYTPWEKYGSNPGRLCRNYCCCCNLRLRRSLLPADLSLSKGSGPAPCAVLTKSAKKIYPLPGVIKSKYSLDDMKNVLQSP